MEIKNFIKIYDEALPWNVLSNLIRYLINLKFQSATVGTGLHTYETNFDVRRTFSYPLTNVNDSMACAHWYNLLYFYFKSYINKYSSDNKILDFNWASINSIEILKYENTGFYTWHVDHFASIPRTISCILLLNNDYEGGNLCFRNPDGSGEWEVEVKPNRMIVWPSNFLYPHTVKSVTKGTRYSVVAWAL